MPITQLTGVTRTGHAPGRSRRVIALSAAIASFATLAAGCGSTSPTPTVPARQSPIAAAFKYSDCMRSHGVANFPDPVDTSSPGHQRVVIEVPRSAAAAPQFQAAHRACAGILPAPRDNPQQQRARERDILAFSRCMRSSRVPTFPDPTSQGQLTVDMVRAAGVDLQAPAVQAAARTCLPAAGGAITAAQVQRAESGGH